MAAMHPACPYCGKMSAKVSGKEIYPHRPDLYSKVFYQCAACDAYVGCHPGTDKALGFPANAALRSIRSAAHRAFDPKWRNGGRTRQAAYKWLSTELGIDVSQCHIGQFDADTCQRVIEICVGYEDDFFEYFD